MSNLYILLILLFVFFLVVIGEVFKIKKDITRLNRMIALLIKEKKNKNE